MFDTTIDGKDIPEKLINDLKDDPVNHPSHYAGGRKFEPVDVINDWELTYNIGNAVKYLSRAGRKGDRIEDLKKAIFYIHYEIYGEKPEAL